METSDRKTHNSLLFSYLPIYIYRKILFFIIVDYLMVIIDVSKRNVCFTRHEFKGFNSFCWQNFTIYKK